MGKKKTAKVPARKAKDGEIWIVEQSEKTRERWVPAEDPESPFPPTKKAATARAKDLNRAMALTSLKFRASRYVRADE